MQTGLYSTQHLAAAGLGRCAIHRAVADRTLSRVRRGWYAATTTPPSLVTAARVGGRLTCLDALRMHGAWTLATPGTHVRVSSGVAVIRVPGVRLHWTPDRVGPGLDSVDDALLSAIGCVDLRAVVVAMDSLVNRRIVTASRLRAIVGTTPRGRRLLALHDPAAESGIETLIRVALRRHRLPVRSQAVIPGVGRVDLLVGERLVIEADGYEWHSDRESFERDRDRDRELVRRGYIVFRPSYRRVTTALDIVIDAVLAVVRRREHLWRAIHRTQLSGSGYLVEL